MAQLTKAQLAAQNNTSFPNNNSKAITPAIHRTFNGNQIDSFAGQKVDITKAALQTLIDDSNIEIGTQYRITNAAAGVAWVWGIDANVISTNAVLEGTQGAGTTTGQWGKYVLETDTFYGNYVTIAKADLDDLIADSGLTVGVWYEISNAATSVIWDRDWTVLAVAATPNSLKTNAEVLYTGPAAIPCTYDPVEAKVVFTQTSPQIPISSTNAEDWGGYSSEVTAYCSIYISEGGGNLLETSTTEDQTVLRFSNVFCLSGPFIGQSGSYNPTTDTFTPYNGTYTPTLSDTDFTVTQVNYVQNGKYVTVTGLLAYSGAGVGIINTKVSLPIPSAFAAITDAWGQVTSKSAAPAYAVGFAQANVSGDLELFCEAPSVYNVISFNATYIII